MCAPQQGQPEVNGSVQTPAAAVAGEKRARSTSDSQRGKHKRLARPSQNKEQNGVAAQSQATNNALNTHQSPFATASQLVTTPLSGHERDEASIRLARLTPQNWLYILEQAQACDTGRDRIEQLQRELKNTAGRLAEAEAELQFTRNKMRNQAGDSSGPAYHSQYQGSLQEMKKVASELQSAFTEFEERSRDCMARLNWENEGTQGRVKAVKEKLEQLDKAIQGLSGQQ